MIKGLKTAIVVLTAALMALFLVSGTAAAAPQADGGDHGKTEANDDNHHPSGKDRTNEPADAEDGEFQGKSKSEPDDDGHGPERDYDDGPGANEDGVEDKPGMEGGMHTSDQDGNNGCGNDDDFEDDNEGWCGKRPTPADDVDDEGTEVEGEDIEDDSDEECVEGSMDDEDCDDSDDSGDADDSDDADDSGNSGSQVGGGALESGENGESGNVGAAGAGIDTEVLGESVGRLPVTAAGEGETRVLGVQLERTPEAAPAVLGTQTNRSAAATLARTGIGIVTLVALGLGLVTLGAMVTRRRTTH